MKYNFVFFVGKLETLDYFTRKIIEGINESEADYYLVDVTRPDTFNCGSFAEFVQRGHVIVFCFNQIGGSLTMPDGKNTWESLNIPVFTFVVDHPRNYDDFFMHPIRNLHVFVLDRNHESFIRRFYPEVKNIYFLPNGGWEEDRDRMASWTERNLDVVYFGSCQPAGFYARIPFLENDGEMFSQECIYRLASRPELTTEAVMQQVIDEWNIKLCEDEYQKLMLDYANPIESAVRRYYKLLAVQTLDQAGINVNIYGDNWEESNYTYGSNIRIHPRISSAECNWIAKQAKIALNFMPWYKAGCSERVFNNMLAGAVCVTDKSSYLEERFQDGRELVFFDLQNPAQMAADVKWLLDNPESAEAIAGRGYAAAAVHDTWGHRFSEILRIAETL